MSDPLHNKKSPDPDWTACPPGEIARLAGRLRRRSRRRLFLRAGAIAAAAGVAAAGVWVLRLGFDPKPEPEPNFGGITCTEARKLAEAYVKNELPPASRERVRQHISQCPHCAPYFRLLGAKS